MNKKIVFIYFMIFKFLFSNSNDYIEILKIIKKYSDFTCNINFKTIKLEGENFIGNYYNKKPYGLWELKNKSIKQCFLYDENRYYKENEYYIIDNKLYYIKYSYINSNYILEDKKNKKIYNLKKNGKKYIIKYSSFNQRYIPKPLYEFIYIETKKNRTLPDYIIDEKWNWSKETRK